MGRATFPVGVRAPTGPPDAIGRRFERPDANLPLPPPGGL
jgi:hypothetical protein